MDLNDLFVLLSCTVLPRVNICGGTAQFSQANYFTKTDKLHNCPENSGLNCAYLSCAYLKTVCYLDECNRAVFTLLICYFFAELEVPPEERPVSNFILGHDGDLSRLEPAKRNLSEGFSFAVRHCDPKFRFHFVGRSSSN